MATISADSGPFESDNTPESLADENRYRPIEIYDPNAHLQTRRDSAIHFDDGLQGTVVGTVVERIGGGRYGGNAVEILGAGGVKYEPEA